MQTDGISRRRARAACTAAVIWGLLASAATAAPEGVSVVGQSVAQVLKDAESRGVRIIFTDQTVPPGLRVAAEPTAHDEIGRLREILRAHGLSLDETSPGVYVVTPQHPAKVVVPAVTTIRTAAAVDQVQISASRYTIDELSTGDVLRAGKVELERQPALFNDAIRSIRRFPGTAGQDVSSRTFVRGGTPDDNLVMLDGVPLYEPFHLRGLPVNFGVIDPAVIDGVDFHSGVLPIEHGSRMGSQVNMHLRDPGDEFSGRVALGMLDASALMSGPLPDDRGDWLFFARRGLYGRVTQMTEPGVGQPKLLDGLTRVRYRFEDGGELTFGSLGATDHAFVVSAPAGFVIDDTSRRRYAWTAYDKDWGRLQSRTRLTYTSIDSRRNGMLFEALNSSGILDDRQHLGSAMLEQAWTLALGSGDAMRWGVSMHEDRAHLDFYRAMTLEENLATFFLREPHTVENLGLKAALHEQGLYWGITHGIASGLTLDAGFRWAHASYSTGQAGDAWDPRVSLRFDVSSATRLRASIGRMTQIWGAAELPVEQGQFRFAEPSRSTMEVLAAEHDFASTLSVRAELFRKRIAHPRPRSENLFFQGAFLPELRPDELVLRPRAARMSGFDLYATATLSDRLDAWLSYSHSYADDWLDGRRVPRAWNQPDALGLGVSMHGHAWLLSAEVFAHTSWPLTPLSSAPAAGTPADGLGTIASNAGPLNSAQSGRFVSVNLKAARIVRLPYGTLRMQAEVVNATDRANECCGEVAFTRLVPDGEIAESLDRHSWLRVVPYASIVWEF